MRFDLQTSLGILCAATSLTCAGCKPNNSSGVVKLDTPEVNSNQSNAKSVSVILTPSNNVPRNATGHTSHGAHMSHSSHASSGY